MWLSLMKAAHVALDSASSRKSGSPGRFRPTYAGANMGHPGRAVTGEGQVCEVVVACIQTGMSNSVRVPQVRTSVRGPKTVFFDRF